MQCHISVAALPHLLLQSPLLHFLFNACYAGFGQWTFRFKRIGKGQSTPTFRKDANPFAAAPLAERRLPCKRTVPYLPPVRLQHSCGADLKYKQQRDAKLHQNPLSGQLLTYKYVNQGDVSLDALPPLDALAPPLVPAKGHREA